MKCQPHYPRFNDISFRLSPLSDTSMKKKNEPEPTEESREANDSPPGKAPSGIERDLGIAHLALTLLEAPSRREEIGHKDQDLILAIRQAKSLLRLASQVDLEVEIYRVFEEDVFLSCEEISIHLKENCQWPCLDSVYLVTEAVKEILESIHREIQEHRQRMERLAQNRSGNHFEVSEAAANIRWAFNDLSIGTELRKLLGPQSEAILQSATNQLIERVHESLEKEGELEECPPRVSEEFFHKVCDGLTYDSYLGHIGTIDEINSTLLRAVLESLQERFEEGLQPIDNESMLKDLESIDQWISSGTTLLLGGVPVFAETIEALTIQSSGSDAAKDLKELFYRELSELANKWAVLRITEEITLETSKRLQEDIKELSLNYKKLKATDCLDEDELDRFREFPHCADAVLEWLQGNRVRPRRFIHDFSANSAETISENSRSSLESLVIGRIAEFQSCILELDYCLGGSFIPYEKSANVSSRIKELNVQLQEQKREVTSPSEPIRKAARERATKLLDAVCSRNPTNFNPGNLNPRLLFEYAAERGIKKLGRKRDQSIVTEATSLKHDCVIYPPKLFALGLERHS